MKTYTVLYAEDVPHYGTREIEAASDDLAVQRAIEITPDAMSTYTDDPNHNNTQHRRIVPIEGPDGVIAEGIYLDQTDMPAVLANELLTARESAQSTSWVHNAAITGDIEALRRICLEHSNWWNNTALPLIAKARGQQ